MRPYDSLNVRNVQNRIRTLGWVDRTIETPSIVVPQKEMIGGGYYPG
jgi:hypothetical protein